MIYNFISKRHFHSGAKLKSKDEANFLILQLTILKRKKKLTQNLYEFGESFPPPPPKNKLINK